MSTNPFENSDGTYLSLVNAEGQYSLWPTHVDLPAGWEVAFGPDSRQACLDHIGASWVDMRPRSLVGQLGEARP
jgi:MbtH protein